MNIFKDYSSHSFSSPYSSLAYGTHYSETIGEDLMTDDNYLDELNQTSNRDFDTLTISSDSTLPSKRSSISEWDATTDCEIETLDTIDPIKLEKKNLDLLLDSYDEDSIDILKYNLNSMRDLSYYKDDSDYDPTNRDSGSRDTEDLRDYNNDPGDYDSGDCDSGDADSEDSKDYLRDYFKYCQDSHKIDPTPSEVSLVTPPATPDHPKFKRTSLITHDPKISVTKTKRHFLVKMGFGPGKLKKLATSRPLVPLTVMKSQEKYKLNGQSRGPVSEIHLDYVKTLTSAKEDRYYSRLNIYELSKILDLDMYHISLTKEVELNILEIFKNHCKFKLGYQTWIRDTKKQERVHLINLLHSYTHHYYPFDVFKLEVIIRRGSYSLMQSRLRKERRSVRDRKKKEGARLDENSWTQ